MSHDYPLYAIAGEEQAGNKGEFRLKFPNPDVISNGYKEQSCTYLNSSGTNTW